MARNFCLGNFSRVPQFCLGNLDLPSKLPRVSTLMLLPVKPLQAIESMYKEIWQNNMCFVHLVLKFFLEELNKSNGHVWQKSRKNTAFTVS